MSEDDTKRPTGRPSTFTQEMADEVCEHIADGKSLRSFCEADGHPRKVTILKWLGQNEDFAAQYARAREMCADSFQDDITDISDRDDLDANDKRVRIDARKWSASKLAPRKYGERLELAGQVTVARISRKPIEADEWEQQHTPPDL